MPSSYIKKPVSKPYNNTTTKTTKPPYFYKPPKFTKPPSFPPTFSVARSIQRAGATPGEANRFAQSKPPHFYKPAPVPDALKNRRDASGQLRVTADTAERLLTTNQPPRFVKPPRFTKATTRDPGPNVQDNTQDVVVDDIPWNPPVDPVPNSSPNPTPPPTFTVPIKTAPIDTVLFKDELVSAEIIADLLFEDIGGQEILTVARHDTVNGQDVKYQPIKNLSSIQQDYDPEKLVKLRATSKDIFANFPISLQPKIPNVGNGPLGSNVYLDSSGNIILEFINLAEDEQVEVQITSSGTIEEVGD